MATLNVLTGVLRDTSFELESKSALAILGRGNDVAVSIPDAAISRKHAQFTFDDGLWYIQDLGSANGTFINEVRIHASSELSTGDQIRCGSTVLLYDSGVAEDFLSEPAEAAQEAGQVELVFDPGETMVAVAFDSLQSKQVARQKQRMMEAGQVALNLSHGIKNILQALRSGQDVMDDAISYRDIDQAKKAWIILKRNLEKVQKLVLDMLKFSKDDKPQTQECQFNRLVESVVETLRPQADEKQIGITMQLDEHLQLATVDPDQMQDVIMNLLINAIEAVEPQTGQVTVHTETDAEQNNLILRVSDNGMGIEDTRVIFEPFHSQKANIGAGLGLTIANKIVKAHGGDIQVQSLPGEGSIFTVTLPLKFE